MTRLLCDLCSHQCRLLPGEHGICRARMRQEDKTVPFDTYSVVALDRIEKHGFFHFQPNARTLSIGFYGCNARCPFCQNATISQSLPSRQKSLILDDSVGQADVIAFTYNEPLLYFERIIEIAKKYKKPIVCKTNGSVNPSVLDQLTNFVQAYNFDIKGDVKYYDKLSINLLTVLDNIRRAIVHQHVEINIFIAPELVESDWSWLREFLSDLPQVPPLHLLYCYPCHEIRHSYSPEKLIPLWSFFREKFNDVYISNVFRPSFLVYRNTYCPHCQNVKICRSPVDGQLSCSCSKDSVR